MVWEGTWRDNLDLEDRLELSVEGFRFRVGGV